MPDPRPQSLPTATLLDRAADGDARARDLLCARYRRPLLDYARGRLPATARGMLDTEDLVQEVLSRSIDKVRSLRRDHDGGFLFYLRRSVLNAVADVYRRRKVRPDQVEIDEQHPDGSPGPLENYLRREEIEIYELALERLEPETRDLIVARLELKQSYRQIAIDMGRPSEDAARMAVKRAVARLAERMREQRGKLTD